MDAATLFLFGLITGFVAVYGTLIAGSIDALGRPREAWERAGFRRSSWVWQAFGVFVFPAGLVYSGVYFVRVRPRLIAAVRDLAIERGTARANLRHPVMLDGPHVEKIKIRIPLSVAGAFALPIVVGWAFGFGLGALTADSGAPSHWAPFIGWGLIGLLAVAVNLAFGVTLTPHDLVMRGFLRRHVAWSDVVAITQESMLGSRYVRLWTHTGRGRRLRAPFTQLGVGRRRFDTDFAVLEQWWAAHTLATD